MSFYTYVSSGRLQKPEISHTHIQTMKEIAAFTISNAEFAREMGLAVAGLHKAHDPRPLGGQFHLTQCSRCRNNHMQINKFCIHRDEYNIF